MRQQIVLMLLITAALMLSACNGDKQLPKRSTDIVCKADVNVCADGQYVRRNPHNNCEFDACNLGKIVQECSINQGCAPNINRLQQ